MTKNKIKLSLIDDYIKIVLIKNFLNNSFSAFELNKEQTDQINHSKTLVCLLDKTYNSIFDKLKLNDLSFEILKKELSQNNILFLRTTASKLNQILNSNNLTLNIILKNLKIKLINLKVDFPYEIFAKI